MATVNAQHPLNILEHQPLMMFSVILVCCETGMVGKDFIAKEVCRSYLLLNGE